MTIYLDYDGFRNQSVLPETSIDDVERRTPGWVDGQLETWARWLDSRLRKRYSTPFAAFNADPPTPPTIQLWITRIVTWRVMLRRGLDPSDMQADTIKADHDLSLEEVLEAANSEDGWFDLPTNPEADASAINRGGTFAYTEASPYVWTDVQAMNGRMEDEAGTGSSD